MRPCRLHAVLALSAALSSFAEEPKLPGIGAAMQEMIANNEIAGAVTVLVTKDRLLHLATTGFGLQLHQFLKKHARASRVHSFLKSSTEHHREIAR